MTEQLPTEYLHMYKSVQIEMYEISQFGKCSTVKLTYLWKVNVPRQDAFREQEHL